MLTTTDAIVLSLQPHSDKAHVLHAYTRAGGRINYRVYGLGRKNAAGKYSPLSLIQITTDDKSIRTANLSFVPTSLTVDPYKRTIALFMSEVLYHVLKHPMVDEPMFDFLTNAIQELDRTDEPQNFHLQFLCDFAAKLGFAIPENHTPHTLHQTPYTIPPTPGTSSRLTGGVASAEKGNLPQTRKARQQALRALCAYFETHVETWQTPKSLDVLMEVFD